MDANTCINTRAAIYDPLIKRITESIRQKQLLPGDFIGSENQLVTQEGLSRVSIRRAVAKMISEGLIERRPGKGLYVRSAEQTTQLVQAIVPSLMHEQNARVVMGAQEEGSKRGIQVVVADAHSNPNQIITLIQKLPESGAHGAIIHSVEDPRYIETIVELKKRKFPFVLLADQYFNTVEVPFLSMDDIKGGYLAGQKILEAGHKKIAFIGNLRGPSDKYRLSGLRDAMTDAGILLNRAWILDLSDCGLLDEWYPSIVKKMHQLWSQEEKPTVLFCCNDTLAMQVCGVLHQLSVKIPDDVSVVGFDDISIARWVFPALSTVRSPYEQMGKQAMITLADLISGKITPSMSVHHILEGEWVERASLKKI